MQALGVFRAEGGGDRTHGINGSLYRCIESKSGRKGSDCNDPGRYMVVWIKGTAALKTEPTVLARV